jgi:hypothetical protein
MITQKHEDEMQQRDQHSSPAEEKQTTTSSEGRSKQAPPSLPRWIVALFSIFGIVLPLVAGSMVNWPWGVEELDNGTVFNMVVPAMGVSVTVGVVILYFAFRARWTCWLAPLAWLVGEFVYGVIDHYALHWTQWGPGAGPYFWGFQVQLIALMLIPFLICMGIGVVLTMAIDALVRRRASRR